MSLGGAPVFITQGAALAGGALAACAAGIHGTLTRTKWHVVAVRMCVLIYAGWVVSVTVLPIGVGMPEIARVEGAYSEYSINLVPLKTIMLYLSSDLGRIALINLLGNMVLLMPLGLFGPIIWRGFDRWWKALTAGVAVSFLIEGGQYVRQLVNVEGIGRSVDIDDVILNALGALIGYALFVVVRAIRRVRTARGA